MQRILAVFSGMGERVTHAVSRLFTKRRIAFALLLLLAFSLLPMLILAKYDRPTGDDYAYSYLTKPVWDETHSLAKVIGAAAQMSAQVYRIWQGSYSACFMMALQPGIFGEQVYAVAPICFILFFVLSGGIFFYTVLHRFFGVDGCSTGIAAVFFCLVCVHFLPSGAQAFYWYNGSVYYTFNFCLSLLLLSLIFGSFRKQRGRLWRCAAAAFLSLFIAGGNLATGLTMLVILVVGALADLLLRRRDPVLLVSAAAFLIGFFINTTAPGNAIRMESEGTGSGFLPSILSSILYTLELYQQWFTVPVLLSGLLMPLALLPALKKAAERFSFRFPLLVILGLILLNAVGLAPLVYSGSNLRIPRLYNVQFYESILLFYIGVSYLAGWAIRQHRKGGADGRARIRQTFVGIAVFASVIFLLPQTPFEAGTQKEISCLSAYHSLISRDAYRYARSRNRRQAILEDDSIRDAVLSPIPDYPELFHFRDLDGSPNAVSDPILENYFHKDSVLMDSASSAN